MQQQEELIEDEEEQEQKEEDARRAKREEEARLAEMLLPETEVSLSGSSSPATYHNDHHVYSYNPRVPRRKSLMLG